MAWLLGLVIVAATACSSDADSAGSSTTVIADGLTAPRGLTLTEDGSLLISEPGGGRVLEYSNDGGLRTVISGLPHSLDSGPGSAYPAGPGAAGYIDGELQVIVGEFKGDRFARLYRITDEPGFEPVTAPNDALSEAVDRFANPYDMVASPDAGQWIVSDAGRNALLTVDRSGRVRDYALFERFTSPVRESPIEIVPTGIALGPDGALYVGSLTGFPHPRGEASIWRVEDMNGDGDAMDNGEREQFVTGLTTVTDVAFDPAGTLYIAEFSSNMQEVIVGGDIAKNAPLHPGRVLKWDGRELVTIRDGLVSPTGIAVDNDYLYVSEEFAGRVKRIRLVK